MNNIYLIMLFIPKGLSMRWSNILIYWLDWRRIALMGSLIYAFAINRDVCYIKYGFNFEFYQFKQYVNDSFRNIESCCGKDRINIGD